MVSLQLRDDLFLAIDDEAAAMRELLARLVEVPTENPPATGYRECVALLESTLDGLGFTRPLRRHRLAPGSRNRSKP